MGTKTTGSVTPHPTPFDAPARLLVEPHGCLAFRPLVPTFRVILGAKEQLLVFQRPPKGDKLVDRGTVNVLRQNRHSISHFVRGRQHRLPGFNLKSKRVLHVRDLAGYFGFRRCLVDCFVSLRLRLKRGF